jgi:hypothetical protein
MTAHAAVHVKHTRPLRPEDYFFDHRGRDCVNLSLLRVRLPECIVVLWSVVVEGATA